MLEYASDRLKNNKEIVLEAVKQNGLALEYASDRLKNNEEIVVTAIKQYESALQFASYRLRQKFCMLTQEFMDLYFLDSYIEMF